MYCRSIEIVRRHSYRVLLVLVSFVLMGTSLPKVWDNEEITDVITSNNPVLEKRFKVVLKPKNAFRQYVYPLLNAEGVGNLLLEIEPSRATEIYEIKKNVPFNNSYEIRCPDNEICTLVFTVKVTMKEPKSNRSIRLRWGLSSTIEENASCTGRSRRSEVEVSIIEKVANETGEKNE